MSEEKYQKTENPNFVKDTNTGALVSMDLLAFKKYKMQMKQHEEAKSQINELNTIRSEVSTLKEQMSEIKEMLQQILNS